jgi:hypothetical protein
MLSVKRVDPLARDGHHLRGERKHNAKLTTAAVRVCRSTDMSSAKLEARFGVTPRLIRLVRAGKIWRRI